MGNKLEQSVPAESPVDPWTLVMKKAGKKGQSPEKLSSLAKLNKPGKPYILLEAPPGMETPTAGKALQDKISTEIG